MGLEKLVLKLIMKNAKKMRTFLRSKSNKESLIYYNILQTIMY